MMNVPLFFRPKIWLLCSLLLLNMTDVSLAQEMPIQEQESSRLTALKTAYVYNFTKFIRWGEMESPTFRICLITDNPSIQKTFLNLTERGTAETPFEVYKISQSTELELCKILYIEQPPDDRWSNIHRPNLLVISDQDNVNATIQFVIINNKLHFNINNTRANQLHLKISSKLLRLANEVH